MAVSDIEKIASRVGWIIGSHGATFVDTVNDDRFILEEIQRAIIETESELARDVCEAYHPMRMPFLAYSADLENGDLIPERIGQVESVLIQPTSTAIPEDWVVGEYTSRTNITAWRANVNNIFDAINHDQAGSSLSGYFNLTNDTITFTGYRAQVNICTYIPNYAAPALQIDNLFDPALVSGAIIRLNKLGVPQAMTSAYGQIYAAQRQLIRQGAMAMPDINEAQDDRLLR